MSNRVNCRKFYLLYFFKELLASLRTDVPLPYLAFQSDENSFYWNNRSCERTHSTFSVLDTAHSGDRLLLSAGLTSIKNRIRKSCTLFPFMRTPQWQTEC